MESLPKVQMLSGGGCIWTHTFTHFTAKVYVPENEWEDGILNYGFLAPYLLVFEEEEETNEQAVAFAKARGFEKLAKAFAGSVVFVYPTSEKGWDDASEELLAEIYSNSKIHQYYKDGAVIARNRFTGEVEDYYIRGAIFRTSLYGYGASADYIATHCIRHFEGDGLWGRADCAPALCTLERLSVMPEIEAKDIPIVSVGNAKKINDFIAQRASHVLLQEEGDVEKAFYSFGRKFRRMVGELELDPDLEAEGMKIDPGVVVVKTSPDNQGDDAGTKEHPVGYFAFYHQGIFDKGPAPLVLAFHGGGDSAFYIAHVSGWARVALRHDFLLVCVENHMNSTATEMMELINHLKDRYAVDSSRIYATGFSMGGCKTWDLIQEYPTVLAAAAPMDATFDVGQNVFGAEVAGGINEEVLVPVFYAGGELTPLPELPCQEKKCFNRMRYVFKINRVAKPCPLSFEKQEEWEHPIWGISGDETRVFHDPVRNADLILQMYFSEDKKCYTVMGCVSGQGHECREHTCEHAWQFMRSFRRNEKQEIEGGGSPF